MYKHGYGRQRLIGYVATNAALQRLDGVPWLPIQDSIRCDVSDAGSVQEPMTVECIAVVGQPIRIETKDYAR